MLRTLFLAMLTLGACDVAAQAGPLRVPQAAIRHAPEYRPDPATYAFLSDAPDGALVRLDEAFQPPEGFRRVSVGDGSFGDFLRGLPLLRDRADVRSYAGESLNSPSAAVVAIDVGSKNLQQCADSAIRLHAEWLWSSGRRDDLAYHFTSGDEVRWSDWAAGERVTAIGSEVKRFRGPGRARNHSSFRDWLDLVFRYAGTRSLALDSRSVAPGALRPGDFFVTPGSPGHAVVVLDVAQSDDGRRVALVGQGFMPAQEFHVLKSDSGTVDGVWFELPQDAGDRLSTPSWKPFDASTARRFHD